jgi:hypothetical protein
MGMQGICAASSHTVLSLSTLLRRPMTVVAREILPHDFGRPEATRGRNLGVATHICLEDEGLEDRSSEYGGVALGR